MPIGLFTLILMVLYAIANGSAFAHCSAIFLHSISFGYALSLLAGNNRLGPESVEARKNEQQT